MYYKKYKRESLDLSEIKDSKEKNIKIQVYLDGIIERGYNIIHYEEKMDNNNKYPILIKTIIGRK